MLYETSEETMKQSQEVSQKVQPWGKVFDYVIMGMLFLLLKFDVSGGDMFSYLFSYAKPFIGYIFTIKGLAICKSENRYFKRAYIVSCVAYICESVIAIILAIPIHQRIWEENIVFMLIQSVINIIIIYNFYRALRQMGNDSKKQINHISWDILYLMLFLYVSMFIAYNLQNNNIIIIFFPIIVILYICILKKNNILKNVLIKQGYEIKENKSRQYGTNIFIICNLAITVVLILFFVNYSSSLPVTIHEIDVESEMLATDMSEPEIDEIKERLVSMGMESYIAEDLLPEDIKQLKDVKQLLKASGEQDFPYAGATLKVTCYIGELYYSEQKVEDSDYSDSYYIDGVYVDALVYYFEWVNKPERPYAEVLLEENMSEQNWNLDFNADLGRWVHIADVGEEKTYYKNNEKSYVHSKDFFGQEDIRIKSGTKIVKNASNYRSYIVRKFYNKGSYCVLDLDFQYLKEQKTYPYCSIYDVAMLGTQPDFSKKFLLGQKYGPVMSLSGELDYFNNNIDITFTINRNEEGHSLSGW